MTRANSNNSDRPAGNERSWLSSQVTMTLAVGGLITALGFLSCNSRDRISNTEANNSATAGTRPAQPPINDAQPPFVPQEVRDIQVGTIDGGSLRLSDYKDKVVIVNIWATWCGPCRLEMPELVKLNNEYKSRGLVVLGLATTYNEHNDPGHVKDYIRSQNVTYKIVWDDGTLAAPLVQLVNARSVIPQSFVISREGRIIKHFQGFNPLRTPQLMREAVEQALGDKSKA